MLKHAYLEGSRWYSSNGQKRNLNIEINWHEYDKKSGKLEKWKKNDLKVKALKWFTRGTLVITTYLTSLTAIKACKK